MHCIPMDSIANAFHRNGTHTIGMDTNGVDAHGVAAAGGRVAGTTWLFRWRIGGETAARAAKPAPVGAAKWPFTHVCSPRDNHHYRASFTHRPPRHRALRWVACGPGGREPRRRLPPPGKPPNAPGVPSGDTHQRGCLIQCHVLREQTVQNLKSGLFFWIQSHILHTVNMTFMLAS